MIERAQQQEIDQILDITKACAAAMCAQGIYQWNDHYPSREAFENDLKNEQLYVYKKNKCVLGTIVISFYKDEEYDAIAWLTPDRNNIYIHRLAVHPEYQKQGIARAMMDYAHDLAMANKALSIRLDTFSQNTRNQKFYEARGYQKLGDIFFPKQSEHPFHCYEYVF